MKKYIPINYIINSPVAITIDVIGAGGLGSALVTELGSLNLALRELGHSGLFVRLYDPKKVADHNTGRQRFSRADVGRYKADVIIERINRFYGTGWISNNVYYDCETPYKANIIVTCPDSAPLRYRVGQVMSNKRHKNAMNINPDKALYWLDLGNGDTYGQAILGTIYSDKLPTVYDMYGDQLKEDNPDEPSCSMRESLERQDLFINKEVAIDGAKLLWNLMYKKVTGMDHHGYFTNQKTGVKRPIKVPLEESKLQEA